jgi:hypothetical protein
MNYYNHYYEVSRLQFDNGKLAYSNSESLGEGDFFCGTNSFFNPLWIHIQKVDGGYSITYTYGYDKQHTIKNGKVAYTCIIFDDGSIGPCLDGKVSLVPVRLEKKRLEIANKISIHLQNAIICKNNKTRPEYDFGFEMWLWFIFWIILIFLFITFVSAMQHQ